MSVGGVAACSPASTTAAGRADTTATGASESTDAMPLWPAPTDVPSRVAAAGLDLGPMGMAEHYHAHLRIILNGRDAQVAANLGVDPATGAMSALHTHEPDGTIHIEADTAGEVFTLGQLFTEWGVALTPIQIGDVKAETGQQVTLTSNGAPVASNPRDLKLQPDQQIVLQLS